MSLKTPDKIRTFQRKLYLKVKSEPDHHFYLLYDKILCLSEAAFFSLPMAGINFYTMKKLAAYWHSYALCICYTVF